MSRHEWKKRQAGRGTKDDPRLQGRELRYAGRTLEVQVFLNTDESAEVVLERLKQVAQGPQRVMVLYAVSEVDREHAEKIWRATWEHAEATVRKEN